VEAATSDAAGKGKDQAQADEQAPPGTPIRWNAAMKGVNVTLHPTDAAIYAGTAAPGETLIGAVKILGAGTIASEDGVLAGGGEERFWEIDVAQTGRGCWVGLVAVPVRGPEGMEAGAGAGAGAGVGGWPDGNLSLSATGWGIWGGETGEFHPMYIKGRTVDQIVGFKAGQTVALHLRPARPDRDSAATTTAAAAEADAASGAGRGVRHELGYLIDGKEVCVAFRAEELPQDRSCTLHLAVSNNGWGGTTIVRARRVSPPC